MTVTSPLAAVSDDTAEAEPADEWHPSGHVSYSSLDLHRRCPQGIITAMPRQGDGRQSHPLYRRWIGMRQRCRDDPKYTSRGIRVAPVWDDFWRFVADVGLPPDSGERMTLDRIDNDGDYEPGNVRWATYSQQNANRRPLKYPVPDRCRRGHVYIPVKDSSGYTRCLECKREHDRLRSLAYQAKKAARHAN